MGTCREGHSWNYGDCEKLIMEGWTPPWQSDQNKDHRHMLEEKVHHAIIRYLEGMRKMFEDSLSSTEGDTREVTGRERALRVVVYYVNSEIEERQNLYAWDKKDVIK